MSFMEIDSLTAAMQQEADRKGLPDNMPPLPEVPAGRYHDPAFHKLEMAVMKRSWLFGIHGDEVPQPGSYKQWTHFGQPLVFVRGNDSKVRCFYNICRHRGSALVCDDSGEKRNLSCPIHGWTYRLDGALAGVPERRDFAEADLHQRSLTEVRCENLGELYFINFDADAKSLLDDLGAIAEAWQMFRPDQSRLVGRFHLTVNANHKIVQEANMEVYHVNTMHPVYVGPFLDSSAAPIELHANGHSIQAARLRKKNFTDSPINLPCAAEAEAVSNLASSSFKVFPNQVIALDAWGYAFLNFWPIDERTTQCETVWIAPRAGAGQNEAVWNEIISSFQVVLQEDFVLCPNTQRSMESGACRGLLMGAQERTIYHVHEEMDRRIGIDRVPAHLRVRPVLDKMLVAA